MGKHGCWSEDVVDGNPNVIFFFKLLFSELVWLSSDSRLLLVDGRRADLRSLNEVPVLFIPRAVLLLGAETDGQPRSRQCALRQARTYVVQTQAEP